MEILKNKIAKYKYECGFSGMHIAVSTLEKWLQEFEERQKSKINEKTDRDYWRDETLRLNRKCFDFEKELSLWKGKCSELLNDLEKQKSNKSWESNYHNIREKYIKLIHEFDTLKYNHMKSSNESFWISAKDQKPPSEQTVLVFNANIESDVPCLAYYLEEYDEFFLIESVRAVPISITHWIRFADTPKKIDKS
jgi:hypothetical protein